MKKFLIFLLVVAVGIGTAIYIFREQVVQYSAETILKKNLPEYITVEKFIFDMKGERLEVKGFAVKNPPGYQDKYLATMDSISCRYTMSGATILDGIAITEIVADSPRINIERAANGRINVNDMGDMMRPLSYEDNVSDESSTDDSTSSGLKVADMIKLPDTMQINNGKVVFMDKKVSRKPYLITFEDVNGVLRLKLNKEFSEVIDLGSKGSGLINGDRSQKIDWVISLDPTARELKMGNRFELSGVDIMLLKPYYDMYSPVDVRAGRVGGTLVFDFDNGNIGSMNTIIISGLSFVVKEDGRGSSGWQASVIPEVVRYLQSSPGEVTFDFSIKGSIDSPRIFPGPRVKAAIQAMAVDTIAGMFQKDNASGDVSGSAASSSDNRSDAEVVVDTLKGLWNKYND